MDPSIHIQSMEVDHEKDDLFRQGVEKRRREP